MSDFVKFCLKKEKKDKEKTHQIDVSCCDFVLFVLHTTPYIVYYAMIFFITNTILPQILLD